MLSLSQTEISTLGYHSVPDDMDIRMENFVLDTDWVWIARDGDTVTAFLAAAPVHGMVFMLRLVVRDGSPLDTLPLLLRQFVRDLRQRGYAGVFSYLDPKRNEELFLMGMLKKMGGVIINSPQFVAAAHVANLEKW